MSTASVNKLLHVGHLSSEGTFLLGESFSFPFVFESTSGNEGDNLFGGDAVPSCDAVPRKVRGIPVVRFAFGTSNRLS